MTYSQNGKQYIVVTSGQAQDARLVPQPCPNLGGRSSRGWWGFTYGPFGVLPLGIALTILYCFTIFNMTVGADAQR